MWLRKWSPRRWTARSPGDLADLIAQNIALRYDDKQAILEELSPMVRLRKLNGLSGP